VVASQVLWLAAFFGGVGACAIGVTYPQQYSAFAVPAACAADLSIFNKLYLSCFAVITSCTIQASCVTLAMAIIGSRKRVDKLPPPSGVWCRRLLLAGVLFCAVSFSCIICVVDLFIFVRASRFACLSGAAKFLVCAGDVVAAILGIGVFIAGSYIAMFCH